MMANIKLKNGSEYPNCFVYGITKFSLNAKIQFGNGRKCLSKSDIEEMDIKTYWDLDKMEQLKEFNYPARQFKKYEILENLSYNAKTEETLELEKKLEEIAISYEADLTSFGTVKDGFIDNSAEFFVIPMYDSVIYDIRDEVRNFFENYEPICAFGEKVHNADDEDDYDVLEITWEYK